MIERFVQREACRIAGCNSGFVNQLRGLWQRDFGGTVVHEPRDGVVGGQQFDATAKYDLKLRRGPRQRNQHCPTGLQFESEGG